MAFNFYDLRDYALIVKGLNIALLEKHHLKSIWVLRSVGSRKLR